MTTERNFSFLFFLAHLTFFFFSFFPSFSKQQSSCYMGLSVTWQPCWNILVTRGNVVVAEVVVSDVGRRLVVAGDTGCVWDGVLLSQHPEGCQRD